MIGVPYRIRTGVAAVRGRCPRPLDEGDEAACRYYQLVSPRSSARRPEAPQDRAICRRRRLSFTTIISGGYLRRSLYLQRINSEILLLVETLRTGRMAFKQLIGDWHLPLIAAPFGMPRSAKCAMPICRF